MYLRPHVISVYVVYCWVYLSFNYYIALLGIVTAS